MVVGAVGGQSRAACDVVLCVRMYVLLGVGPAEMQSQMFVKAPFAKAPSNRTRQSLLDSYHITLCEAG